jgi:hypothetical protein
MAQIEVTIDSVRHGMPTNVWVVILKEKGADRSAYLGKPVPGRHSHR